MNGLKVRELVIICIDADTEEKASITAVDDLVIAKLKAISTTPKFVMRF